MGAAMHRIPSPNDEPRPALSPCTKIDELVGSSPAEVSCSPSFESEARPVLVSRAPSPCEFAQPRPSPSAESFAHGHAPLDPSPKQYETLCSLTWIAIAS